MAEFNWTTTPSEFADRTATSRAVADDMAAIFGTDRHGDPAPMAPDVPAVRSRRPRMALAALTAAGLAVIVGAGVMAGGSAIGVPMLASDASARSTPRTMSRLPASIAVAGPTATAPAVAPPVEIAAPAIEVPAPAAALPIVDAEPMVVHRVTAREPAALSPAAAAAAATTVATVEQAAPRATGCDGDDACIDGRLEVAEREIAAAYADATDAGVRAKILRGYRNEWLRTRQEVDDRPREALRLYAMMTSDLRNLSEDAAGAGRPDWR